MSWEREPNYICSLMNILKKKPTVSKVQELKPNVSSKQLEKPKKKKKKKQYVYPISIPKTQTLIFLYKKSF